MKRMYAIAAIGLTLCAWGGHAWANVVIDTVTVGNAGNPPDMRYGSPGYGAVDYVYQIGKFEITAGQYTELLNAVAAADTYDLYNPLMASANGGCNIQRHGSPGSYTYSVAPDWADRPVTYISWGDAARFCNWLHNGQPTGPQGPGTTEDGSYFLNGATTNTELMAVVRKPGATWVIPSEHEWYKAAYHKNDGPTGHYYDYPTRSDIAPSNDLIDPDPGNNANYYSDGYTIGAPYYRTVVGEFENSYSPYGTFDQAGNVWEFTEGIIDPEHRALRGGSFNSIWQTNLHAGHHYTYDPTEEFWDVAFRVAVVPEPGTAALLVLGVLVTVRRR